MMNCRLRAVIKCLDVSMNSLSKQSGVSVRDIKYMICYGIKDEKAGNNLAEALNVSLAYLNGEFDPESEKYVIAVAMKNVIASLHRYDKKDVQKIRKEPRHVKD